MIEDIACVILAGGKSSRMGQDKALLPFGGYNSLAEYQYNRMQEIFDKVYISAKEDKFDFDCQVILDKYVEHSPMHALASIFDTIDREAIFLLAVDMPFFDGKVIGSLIEAYKNDTKSNIICYKRKNYEPLSAIYRKGIKQKIYTMIKSNNFKLQILFENSEKSILYAQNGTPFENLNYYNDYLKNLL